MSGKGMRELGASFWDAPTCLDLAKQAAHLVPPTKAGLMSDLAPFTLHPSLHNARALLALRENADWYGVPAELKRFAYSLFCRTRRNNIPIVFDAWVENAGPAQYGCAVLVRHPFRQETPPFRAYLRESARAAINQHLPWLKSRDLDEGIEFYLPDWFRYRCIGDHMPERLTLADLYDGMGYGQKLLRPG